jgi:hypothetical protein
MDDNDFIFSTSNTTGIDSDGNMMMRMSDNTIMDMDSGEIHFVSSWDDDNDQLRIPIHLIVYGDFLLKLIKFFNNIVRCTTCQL